MTQLQRSSQTLGNRSQSSVRTWLKRPKPIWIPLEPANLQRTPGRLTHIKCIEVLSFKDYNSSLISNLHRNWFTERFRTIKEKIDEISQ